MDSYIKEGSKAPLNLSIMTPTPELLDPTNPITPSSFMREQQASPIPSPTTSNPPYSPYPSPGFSSSPGTPYSMSSEDFGAASSDSPSSRKPTSKRKPSPKKSDPLYVPRPENAFMLFRKATVAKIKADTLEAQASLPQDSKKKVKFQRQADMSKHISHLWRSLPDHERIVWEQQAAVIKREHEAKHPNYRYHPAQKPRPESPTESKRKDKGKGVRRRTETSNDEESQPPSTPPALMPSADASSPPSDFPITPPMNEDTALPEFPDLHQTTNIKPAAEPFDNGRQLYFPRENTIIGVRDSQPVDPAFFGPQNGFAPQNFPSSMEDLVFLETFFSNRPDYDMANAFTNVAPAPLNLHHTLGNSQSFSSDGSLEGTNHIWNQQAQQPTRSDAGHVAPAALVATTSAGPTAFGSGIPNELEHSLHAPAMFSGTRTALKPASSFSADFNSLSGMQYDDWVQLVSMHDVSPGGSGIWASGSGTNGGATNPGTGTNENIPLDNVNLDDNGASARPHTF